MAAETPATASVVIPFGGGVEPLEDQLAALAAQEDAPPFDVVVAVNRPELLTRASALAEREDLSIRVVPAWSTIGPSAARNVGWRATSAPLVLFCDADDRCGRRWVVGLVRALAADPLVRGRLEYDSLNAVPFSFSRVSGATHPTKFGHLPFGPSCCLGVRRDLLLQLGGFDERLRTGEDIDLCWRAQYAGASLGYAEEAVVAYRLRQRGADVFRQGVSYGRADRQLLALHRAHGARSRIAGRLRRGVLDASAVVLGVRGRADRLKAALVLGAAAGRIVSVLWPRTVQKSAEDS